MKITSAVFKGSFVKTEICPTGSNPEFAFIGRSNVGKSSLINMLCLKKDLVKVSRSPGKTRTMNYFLINEQIHFVDLPGYGYAKRSQKERGEWEKMIIDYLINREQLQCVFVLIDSRVEPQRLDLEFIDKLGINQVPFVLVFTKTDKQSSNEIQKTIAAFQKIMSQNWESIPQTFITSATTKKGREELLDFISHPKS